MKECLWESLLSQVMSTVFPHRDVEALAKIISQLHEDKQFYQQIADKCYERAKQFDISKMVIQYNEKYLSLFE